MSLRFTLHDSSKKKSDWAVKPVWFGSSPSCEKELPRHSRVFTETRTSHCHTVVSEATQHYAETRDPPSQDPRDHTEQAIQGITTHNDALRCWQRQCRVATEVVRQKWKRQWKGSRVKSDAAYGTQGTLRIRRSLSSSILCSVQTSVKSTSWTFAELASHFSLSAGVLCLFVVCFFV